ncbi:efflux RND transporter periplasmic adaptor subunit [Neptuniibacter sp. QD72_48]|uniref:efflux RND transporter periplasmic adaptor subunit n=1 Tax=unclassified Neptuniibacter TaxID=2630693 RepID=UPI0039F4F42E
MKSLLLHLGILLAISQIPSSYADDKLEGFDCLIKPHSLADVSTREQGVVEALLVDRGDLITMGQEIAKLDADIEEVTVKLAKTRASITAEVSERRADLNFASRELSRIKELHKKRAISAQLLDEARTNYSKANLQLKQAINRQAIAEIELERAQKFYDRRIIRSPLNGIVVDRKISLGESVDNRPILQVAEVDPLNVELIVPVDFYGKITVGMEATVLPEYPGAKAHPAEVVVVDKIVDPASDTFGVRLELSNPELTIPSGVRCNITFNPNETEAISAIDTSE